MVTQSDRLCRTLSTPGTALRAPSARRLELDLPELREDIVQDIAQLEASEQLDYAAIRLHRVTPTLPLLCRLRSPCSLDLSHTNITREELSGLQRCHNLVNLDLSFCRDLTDLSPISHIKTLEVLRLSGCKELSGLRFFGSLPRLKELDLSKTPIMYEEIRLLTDCNTLVKIDLHSCEALTNVNPLCFIATLEEIDLYCCTALTHVGALGRLPVLKEIDLSETRITDEEVRLLSQSKTLVKVYLNSCEALTNVDPLSCIATLEEIGLSECTSLTHVGALGKLPVLKDIDLSGTRVTDGDVYSLTSLRQQLGLPSICLRR